MGTDIHLIVERKQNDKWERIHPPTEFKRDPWVLKQIAKMESTDYPQKERDDPNGMYIYYINKRERDWYSYRNYKLFAILADVRNGMGFGGVKTGQGYNPIAQPKGLPPDCSSYNADTDHPKDNREPFGFGDHSYSWLTLKELLEYNWNQTTLNCGIISWNAYKERVAKNYKGEPDTYSGDVWGEGIEVLEETEARDLLIAGKEPDCNQPMVCVWWTETYAESARSFYTDVIPALQKIEPNPDNIRIVFGFDS